jgi:predicted nucleotidyltransferase
LKVAPLPARSVKIIRRIARLHGVTAVWVFGSVSRSQDGPESDLDLLVRLEPSRTLFDLSGFRLDVQEVLRQKVDVITTGGLNPALAARIRKDSNTLPDLLSIGNLE